MAVQPALTLAWAERAPYSFDELLKDSNPRPVVSAPHHADCTLPPPVLLAVLLLKCQPAVRGTH
ncbi:MAG: hypothetical protein O7C61_10425 [SAR324 cluster bacterium]|nr:hypothetical protein [SAR324 cluster bacterium]